MNPGQTPIDPAVAALLKASESTVLARVEHALALQQAQRLPRLLMCGNSFDELAQRLVRTLGGPRPAAAYLIEMNRQACNAVEELLLRVYLVDEDQPPTQHPL